MKYEYLKISESFFGVLVPSTLKMQIFVHFNLCMVKRKNVHANKINNLVIFCYAGLSKNKEMIKLIS